MQKMEWDELRSEVDQVNLRFIDLARQMEAFFLQKRFLLSALKPELIVKEVCWINSLFNYVMLTGYVYFERTYKNYGMN